MTSQEKLAIIGRGMIGSAAARHLSKAGHDVTLIGPVEPEIRATHQGVFGSHYDEGRITRLLDPHPIWEDLAANSIARYNEIKTESGISFYTEAGLLIGAPEGSDYLQKLRNVRDSRQIASKELTGSAFKQAFPYLGFDSDMVLLHQPQQAGHISPRRLVAAQTKAALRHGANILDEQVFECAGNTVRTATENLHFDRILIACGAFTNALLERPLALRPLARTITFFELEQKEAKRLNAMPSIIYRLPDNSDPYVLPPILYPNGKTYLKIGGEPVDQLLSTPDEMTRWFQSQGNPDLKDYMTQRVEELVPGISYKSVHTEACAVTYTDTDLPYIGPISDIITVATGGCGGAAKSSDEIGRIAANALLGQQDPRFQVNFQDEGPHAA